jgi:uroporphyrinogen decarboxylase
MAEEKLLLQALRRRSVTRAPIWLMRQAGRYLPEYRALRREVGSFLELCYSPDLAVEITLQPVRRFGMDAAILFSDILVVPDALGARVEFVEGQGPKLHPIRDTSAIAGLVTTHLHEHLAPVYETIRRLRGALPQETALIGFAGAPWTVAAYMVEGQTSKDFVEARALARRDSEAFACLIGILTAATRDYLLAQIAAGAEVVQIFDSWAGILPEPEFIRWCERPVREIVASIHAAHPDVPIIAFPRGAGAMYARFVQEVDVDAVSLDTTVPLAWAKRELPGVCLQGNLDPVALLAGGETLRTEAGRILSTLGGTPFVFNLGHGVLPETDPAAVTALVEQVKSTNLSSGAG